MHENKINPLEIASTIDEVWAVYNRVPCGSGIEEVTLQKAFELASTVDEAMRVYRVAPSNSAIEERALRKAINLVSTLDGAWDIYHCHASPNDKLSMEVLRKVLELSTTIDDIKSVYDVSPCGSDIEKEALKKIEEITQKSIYVLIGVK